MKKKLCSLFVLLALCMAWQCCPAFALEDDDPVVITKDNVNEIFTVDEESSGLVLVPGNYKLENDLVFKKADGVYYPEAYLDAKDNKPGDEDIFIDDNGVVVKENGDVTIDLNGHTIWYNGNSFAVFQNKGTSVTFTIKDSVGTGVINCNKDNSAVGVLSATFNMQGGTITNCNRGVTMLSGTFNMTGGKITNGHGNAIYNLGGTINMYDGAEISNFKSVDNGGSHAVINNSGTFNMCGGTIKDCYVYGNAESGVLGGALYNMGAFNMTGGTIKDCAAYASSDGETLSKDQSIVKGSTIYNNGGTINMTGGTIMKGTKAYLHRDETDQVTGVADRVYYYENLPEGMNGLHNDGGTIESIIYDGDVVNTCVYFGKMNGTPTFDIGYINGGTFNGIVTNLTCTVEYDGNIADASAHIAGGTFNGKVMNEGYINSGTFNAEVVNDKTITGGIFYDHVLNNVGYVISGGTFYGRVDSMGRVTDSLLKYDGVSNGAFYGGAYHGTDASPDFYKAINAYDCRAYTVTFDLDGGEGDIPQQYIVNGFRYDGKYIEDKKALKPQDPTKKGYTFEGWYWGDTLYDFDTIISKELFGDDYIDRHPEQGVNGNITLTAKWSKVSSSSGRSTYSISVGETTNGKITVSKEKASYGEMITINVAPDAGYTLETITVTDSFGNNIEVTDKGDGSYTFKMNASKVTVNASFMDDNTMLNYFTDVAAGDYYYDAVLWAVKNGITSGVNDVHFAPGNNCSRAQLVTFLWRASGSPVVNYAMDFTDVDADAYYAEAVRWAASLGIVTGYGNGLFGADDNITREQMTVMLYRYTETSGGDITQGGMEAFEFADWEQVSDYAGAAMQWAVNAGIINGIDGKLMPASNCTRAQIVTMMYRLLGK